VALALLASAPAAAEVNVRLHMDLGELAQCISESGAVFYGAHWCPVCRHQRESFGEHAGALPYFECYDGPKAAGMNDRCAEAGVRAVPTWVFSDGRVEVGEMTPAALATATGCWSR
jgi:hypothetical protein